MEELGADAVLFLEEHAVRGMSTMVRLAGLQDHLFGRALIPSEFKFRTALERHATETFVNHLNAFLSRAEHHD
jgi:hypothetical protein